MITMSEYKCIVLKMIGFAVFLAVCIGFFPNNDASAYQFEWDENHPNDNVDEYRIYYRKNSENYDPDRYLQVVVVVNLCDDDGCSWSWDPQDVAEEYCFFMTAVEYVDGKPFESDRSNTAGRGSSCKTEIMDPPNDGKSGGGGGGGGGCFLKVIFSIFGFSPD